MIVRSIKEKADAQRSTSQVVADFLTEMFGSVWFLTLNMIWFAVWIVLNTRIIPGLEPFDPFPFGLLTMIVSLEAIALAIIVLISQNREEQVSELRQEVDLQLDVFSEKKISRILELLVDVAEKQGVDVKRDAQLHEMLTPMDVEYLEGMLERSRELRKKKSRV